MGDEAHTVEVIRGRTMSRLRGEVPPGLEMPAEPAKTIGRYEIVKTLGRGAMGVVYQARDPLLDRVVALKTIVSPQGAGRRVRAAYLERFQREARAAAKMQHPAIVTIFDVGVDETTEAPFMVLEYLPGETLADRLDRVRLPLASCVQIALDLASALAFAHRQRIVHRDVKPANVLHAGENRWKLADFGIARMPDSDLTQVGIFMGTPGYSPPEAIREGRYTPQADVFAWGACFYEMVCGRIPYEGPDTKTTNSYVVRGDLSPPTRYDATIPSPLVNVIMTALQGSSGTRYRDCADAETALREAWQQCLTEGLVHPSVLAAPELAHDKAPAGMHARVVAAGGGDGADSDTIDTRDTRDTIPVATIVAEDTGLTGPTVVDRPRVRDDDPTTVLRREPSANPDEEWAAGVRRPGAPASVKKKSNRDSDLAKGGPADGAAAPVRSPPQAAGASRGAFFRPVPTRVLIIAVAAVVALLAALVVVTVIL